MKTLDQIDTQMQTLRTKINDCKVELRKLQGERDQLVARAKIEAMPDAERRELLIMAKSIESAEALGQPGAKKK